MPAFYDNPSPKGIISERFAAIVPGTALPFRTKGIYVGGAGDVVVKDAAGVTTTFKAVPAGTQLIVSADSVEVATTASNLVGLY